MSKPNLPEIAEIASVVGSIAATVPAFIYNQAAIACIPLSLSLALNLLNRKQLVAQAHQLCQNQQAVLQAEVTQFRQQYSDLQTELGQLQLWSSKITKEQSEARSQIDNLVEPISHLQEFSTQYSQEQDRTQEIIAKLEEQQSLNNTEILNFAAQLTVAQTLNAQLFQVAQQWEKQYESWEQEKAEIADLMKSRVSSSNSVEVTDDQNSLSFYQIAEKYSQEQDWKAALANYTKAIEITPDYAEAYRDRGLAKANLADKKGALADLRKAAELFFEEGDIDSYQKTKDLTKKLHELPVLENSVELGPEDVQSLFSSVI
jgi:tetratricopeptide (TPR) repeat protein